MRLLHTSDWHVGRAVRGRSRAAEHEAVLAEIAGIADSHDVDAVLVGGDLFDTAAPSPESERIVYRALLDLAGPRGGERGRRGRDVVVIAGNHDSPHRLGAVRPLLDLGAVHLLASPSRPDDGGVLDLVIGDETARIALVPFPSQRTIVLADDLMTGHAAEANQQYAERVKRVLAALCDGFGADTINIVLAHLMVAGGAMGGGERSAHTVFDYWVPTTAFPATAHYVALGHLHRAQSLDGPCPVRYCGSPLQLDFGESGDAKSVTIIEAHPGQPARIDTVPLRSGRDLRTIIGTLAELAGLVDTTGDDHLRVVVREAPRAGLADDVRALFPDAVDVAVEASAVAEATGPRSDRVGRAPTELFAEYLAERGVDDDRLTALFAELLDDDASAPAG
jgi:exonuclease SbcD